MNARAQFTITEKEAATLCADILRQRHGFDTNDEVNVIISQPATSAALASIDRPLPPKAMALARANDRIGAIREVRAAWGFDLKGAKDYVELYMYVAGLAPAPYGHRDYIPKQ